MSAEHEAPEAATGDPGRRPAHRLLLVVLLGAGAAGGAVSAVFDMRLVRSARAFCHLGVASIGKNWLGVEFLPSRLVLGALVGLASVLVGFWWYRRTAVPGWSIVLGTMVLVAALLGGMIVRDFAIDGTPAGEIGETGICPRSNVPPWWPIWLPS